MEGTGSLGRRLGGALAAAVDVLLPPRCLGCGCTVDRPGALCPSCWRGIHFAAPPHCARCGYPFAYDLGPSALCGACSREAPPFDRARFVMRYDDRSRDLLIAFKHRDRTDAAPVFAGWMRRAGAEVIESADLVVPVPLHRWRLLSRRFNQAALLALALGAQAARPVVPDLLVRRRNTPSQRRLDPAARRRNVSGAFDVPPERRTRLIDKRVLLIDDVLTTGATVEACARALRRRGAGAVDVLVLARVIRPQRPD